MQWDQVDDTINDQMKHVFETDKNGTAAIFYRSCLKGTSSIDSWNMLTPWMDLSENITSNASFVDAMRREDGAPPPLPSPPLARLVAGWWPGVALGGRRLLAPPRLN